MRKKDHIEKIPRDVNIPASIYPPPGRCPSWSPGNELKCVGAKGHDGSCHAVRVHGIDKGAKAVWSRALEVVTDEAEAPIADVTPTATPTEE